MHKKHPLTFITGASEGLGKAIAFELASRGHDLVLNARGAQNLTSIKQTIENNYSVTCHIIPADLSHQDELGKIIDYFKSGAEIPDYIINNAAIGLSGNFHDAEASQIKNLCDLNMKAIASLTHFFLTQYLKTGKKGTILNIASLGGFTSIPHQSMYYASKAFVISLSESLDYSYKKKGIRILSACPGPLKTDIHKKMGSEKGFYLLVFPPMDAKKAAKKIVRAMIFGRRIFVPGIINKFYSLCLRIIPAPLLMPFLSPLFKIRRK